MKQNSELLQDLRQAINEQVRLYEEYSKKFVNTKPLTGRTVTVHDAAEMGAAQNAYKDAEKKAKTLAKEFFGF